jgi:rhodanese-related sulfurtransferase
MLDPTSALITRDEIKALLDHGQPIRLVEVLAAYHYRKYHLPGAINLPILGMRHLAEQMLPDKSALIVAYCLNARCASSARAVMLLNEMGYTHVREYREGKEDWLATGYPVEGEAAPTLTPTQAQ